jgi:hypothetical protein
MLAESLARLIALALNLEESFFDQPGLLVSEETNF